MYGRVARALWDFEFVRRSLVLEWRGFCHCYPDTGARNHTKYPPLKNVED
jgi:hypothetical protein